MMAPVCIMGDVTKAFLQVEINECNRYAFRFLYKNKQEKEKVYRFCRVPFGGESSPFCLAGVIEHHLESVEGDKEVISQLKENTYVDNIMGLVRDEKEAEEFKSESIKSMKKGMFPLAKWESNKASINDDKDKVKTKLLGVEWNKEHLQ